MSAKPFTHVVDNNTEEIIDSLGQSTFQKVQYPALGSIPEANQVSYVEIEVPAQEAKFLGDGTIQQRKDFLTNFYRQLLIRVFMMTVFQLFSLMHWFRAIVVKRHRHYSYYSSWQHTSFRWTFWTFFGIQLALMLATVILRKTRFIKYTQTINLYFQNVLLSFLLVGITGLSSENYHYSSVMWTTILILVGIMGYIIVQLANIKFEFLKITPKKIISATFILSFLINLIRAFFSSHIPSYWIFIELFIPYIMYYFLQMNQSVLEPVYQEGDCQCKWLMKIKEMMINLFYNGNQVNVEEQQALTRIGEKYFVIKKTHFKFLLRLIVLVSIILLSIFSHSFLILIIIWGVQAAGILLQSQIVPNKKEIQVEFNDYNLSVCLMPFDILLPMKNIKRTRLRARGQ